MYKATVRALVKWSLRQLNDGNVDALMKLAAPDVELLFPGNNYLSNMYRVPEPGRVPFVTHNGVAECRTFAEQIVADGLQFEVEDILVNGTPRHTRVAAKIHNFIPGPADEGDLYNNRFVAFLDIRWGKISRWEDFEDTERVAAFDRARGRSIPAG